jgi:hypothetical protein
MLNSEPKPKIKDKRKADHEKMIGFAEERKTKFQTSNLTITPTANVITTRPRHPSGTLAASSVTIS